MADPLRNGPIERDVEQEESILIWYSGRKEKQLKLSYVSKIMPGQRSLIMHLPWTNWTIALKALISRGNILKLRAEPAKSEQTAPETDSPNACTQKGSPIFSTDLLHKDSGNAQHVQIPYDRQPINGFRKVFSDVILYTAPAKNAFQLNSACNSLHTSSIEGEDISNGRGSVVEAFRISLSNAVSSSCHESGYEEFDALGDVFIWGEGIGGGFLGGGLHMVGSLSATKIDTPLP